MNLAALFSGGKDSTFAIFKEIQRGNRVVCIASVIPNSEESTLLHHPNMQITNLQAKSMGIPYISEKTTSDNIEDEMFTLLKLLEKAKNEFSIDGFLHGGILSKFQKERFEIIGKKLKLKMFSPLWGTDQKGYLEELLNSKFKFIISSVSTDGLDESWLGKEISFEDVKRLEILSSKNGFNLNFEGGEAETLVVDCPLFSFPIKILNSEKIWDGYRGRFEITQAIIEK